MSIENGKQFGLPKGVIKKIQSVFAKYNKIERVILSGSRAKGTYRLNSDIDLYIQGESLSLTQLLKVENELDDLLLPWKIDLSLKHKIHNQELLNHITKYGVLFF